MIIINTRPELLSSNLISLCKSQKIQLVNAPLSSVKAIHTNISEQDWKLKLKDANYYKNIIFTSQASAIFGLVNLLKHADVENFNIFAVGPATKNIITSKGIDSLTPSEPSSKGLLSLIKSNYPGRNLLFCGQNSNRYLQENLMGSIDEVPCYKLVYSKEELTKFLNGPKITLIYNFLTFSFLFDSIELSIMKEKIFVVASERIKEKILDLTKDISLEIYVAKDPSDNSMLDIAKKFI